MVPGSSVLCCLPATHVVVIFFPHNTVWQIILPHSQQKTGCGESLCGAPRAVHVIRVGLPSPDFAEGSRVGAIGAPAPIAKFGCCQCPCHRSTQAVLQTYTLPWRPLQDLFLTQPLLGGDSKCINQRKPWEEDLGHSSLE